MELNGDSYINDDSCKRDPRSDLFSFFALLMRYPEQSFFDDEVLDALRGLLKFCELDTPLAGLIEWQDDRDAQQLLNDAQTAYTHLFINAAPHVIAPPYASVYLDGDLQGRTTEQIREFYLQHGFDVHVPGEPADHIRFQFEFIAALFADDQEEAAVTFIRTLLHPWFCRFYERFSKEPRHPFYEASLQLIHTIVKEEQ
jgi:TorA maturation chaperone TorD